MSNKQKQEKMESTKNILVTIKTSKFEEFKTDVKNQLGLNPNPNWFEETNHTFSEIYKCDSYQEMILKRIEKQYKPVEY